MDHSEVIPPETSATQQPKVDVMVERRDNFVIPGFQRIAEEIQAARASNASSVAVVTTNDEEDDDFQAKPSKIFKLTSTLKKEGCENGTGELQPKNSISSYEFRQDVLKILKTFFKYAFTIIIKRRRLCPANAFKMTRVFRVEVPKFLHPSSLEYVEEISRKLLVLIHRNTSEGCVIHIMIEKNKTQYVVQRFVFKTKGTLENMRKDGDDEHKVEDLDVDDVRAQCRASLLQLLNSDMIKPMTAPQYSRWSISIGVTKEFGTADDFEELWDGDPSSNYFPWKVKQRSLADPPKLDSQMENASFKSSTKITSLQICDSTNISEHSSTNSVQSHQPEIEESSDECKLSRTANNNDATIVSDSQPTGSVVPATFNQVNDQVHAAKQRNMSTDVEGSKPTCFGVSSFFVTSNFQLSIYGLEYPAPIKKNCNNPMLSPRIGKSPNMSYRDRLYVLKHKLLRQSNQHHRSRTPSSTSLSTY